VTGSQKSKFVHQGWLAANNQLTAMMHWIQIIFKKT